jgi:hypothetical protein
MMKKILAALAISALSLKAFANPVSQDNMDSYKTAVGMAISAGSWICTPVTGTVPVKGFVFREVIESASLVDVSSKGSQPVLIFTDISASGDEKSVITVTTSVDGKAIVSMQGDVFVQGQKNIGDLQNPKIVNDFLPEFSVACNNQN